MTNTFSQGTRSSPLQSRSGNVGRSAAPIARKEVTQFKLSRIYAEGWNAANGMPSNELCELGSGKEVAMNPYSDEPERSRWSDGFRKACEK
jgi:ribosome modulation factor